MRWLISGRRMRAKREHMALLFGSLLQEPIVSRTSSLASQQFCKVPRLAMPWAEGDVCAE